MRGVVFAAIATAIGMGTAMAQNNGFQNFQGFQNFESGSNPNAHYVQPHFNSNGTFTQGHYQTNPNGTQMDNFGTRGNYNPYTGSYGTNVPRY